MANHLKAEYLPQLASSTLGDPQIYSSYEIGIVHLGLGNFHRAHQAIYTEEAIIAAAGPCTFAICGVTFQGSTAKRDRLASQDNLYSVLERDGQGERISIVQILRQVLALPRDLPGLERRFSDPSLRIISLTVTEKGYCRTTDGAGVDFSHPTIQHDVAHPHAPISAPGVVMWGLNIRRKLNLPPLTVMSCDNLPNNSGLLRSVVLSLASATEKQHGDFCGLTDWISENATFPRTMVDRMVPATTDEDRSAVRAKLGLEDPMVVPCEPFRQWVIEDKFANGRPEWENVGAQIVSDVAPFEEAKLRMLNGAHSALAYLSLLAGLDTVDQAMAYSPLRNFIESTLTHEVMPTLRESSQIMDLSEYRSALMVRFSNPTLLHRTAQIAMDGSQKLPQRLLSPIVDRKMANVPSGCLTFAVAGWLAYIRSTTKAGNPIFDPLAIPLSEAAANTDEALYLESILKIEGIFPSELKQDAAFRDDLLQKLSWLQNDALGALDQINTWSNATYQMGG